MATELRLDPELASVVKNARRRAADLGEWPRTTIPGVAPIIPPVAADLLAEWLRDGGYDEAIARISVEDPDLANE